MVYVLKILFQKKVFLFQVLLGLHFLLLLVIILNFIHLESFRCLVWYASYFILAHYYTRNNFIPLALWYCLYCKLNSHIPMTLNFILLHCWFFFFFFPLYPEACFSAAIEDLVSSQSQGLLLECCIWNSSDISTQVHLLWTHITFTTLENFYFYAFSVLFHSSSHVYILYFNWIINSEQAQDYLHIFDSVLVSSANRAPKVIIITMM